MGCQGSMLNVNAINPKFVHIISDTVFYQL